MSMNNTKIRALHTRNESDHSLAENITLSEFIAQELCESRGGRPRLSVLTSLLVSVEVKPYGTMLRHWSQLVPVIYTDI